MRGLPPLDSGSIARLRKRDPDTLRAVVDLHGRRLYRAARGMGCSTDSASDIVQDVFVVFLRSLDRFEGRSQVGTWLFGILYHKIREQRRPSAYEQRHDSIDSIDDAFDQQFDESDTWIQRPIAPDRWMRSREAGAAIAVCLEGLTPLQRDVFQLRQVDDLSAADVSTILGQTVNHIGVLFHRARLRLRDCLALKGWKNG
jgi:RNA polymerase sigma-70 factor (ECF subfamily)